MPNEQLFSCTQYFLLMIASFRNTLKVALSNHFLEEWYLLHRKMMLNSGRFDNSCGGGLALNESEICSINTINKCNTKITK